MMVPVSAPWAQVTLYYGSFFAANAVLGIFGGWIGHTQNGNIAVDVERGASGTQCVEDLSAAEVSKQRGWIS